MAVGHLLMAEAHRAFRRLKSRRSPQIPIQCCSIPAECIVGFDMDSTNRPLGRWTGKNSHEKQIEKQYPGNSGLEYRIRGK